MRNFPPRLSRRWFPVILETYAAELRPEPPVSVEYVVAEASRLLALAPWHFRILVGGIELVATLWCIAYRLLHKAPVDYAQEMAAFAKLPLIATPLLRLYRSLLALSWFEQPEVMSALGLRETLPARRDHFRSVRQGAL